MIRNYFLITVRIFRRDLSYSIINLLGLVVGLSAFLLILLFVREERSYDNFHYNKDVTYRVTQKFFKEGVLNYHGAATFPKLAPVLKHEFPEVVETCRLFKKYHPGIVRHQDKYFSEENLFYAEPSFFDIFSFQLIKGDRRTALSNPQTAIIEEKMAAKYFGHEDPIGKRITVGSMDGIEEFEVTGVFTRPLNTHINCDFVFSWSSFINLNGQEVNDIWGWYDFYTYIIVNQGAKIEEIANKFPALADKHGGSRAGSKTVGFGLQKITDIHLKSSLTSEFQTNGNDELNKTLIIISILILVIAWINYINLSTAKSENRGKEITLRKVVGSSRSELMMQFMFESLMTNLLAILLVPIVLFIAIPHFNSLTGAHLTISLLFSPGLVVSAFLIWLVGSFCSGLYPAIMLALKNDLAAHKERKTNAFFSLRNSLVIIQCTISCILIAGSFIAARQLSFMTKSDIGVDTSNMMVINTPDVIIGNYYSNLNVLMNKLSSHPGAEEAALSSDVPGKYVSWYGIARRPGEDHRSQQGTSIFRVAIDEHFLPLYKNEFVVGRNFSISENEGHIIINQKGSESLGYTTPEEALQQTILIGSDTCTIIGVIRDFHHESLKEPIKPIAYHNIKEERRFISLRVKESEVQDFSKYASKIYYEIFPEVPFSYFFISDLVSGQYNSDKANHYMILSFGGLALIIALIGMVGLTSFAMSKRRKEICVRKILGGSHESLFNLLLLDFLFLVLISNIISLPIVYYLGQNWLEQFAYHISFPFVIFLLLPTISLTITVVVISMYLYRTINLNPVNELRQE